MKKTRRMKAIYIASPYSAPSKEEIENNVTKSVLVADVLANAGYLPFCPLLTHFWHQIRPREYESWLKMDNEWLLRCDCLLRLPGKSAGADAEERLAKKHGIPIYYSVESLLENFPP